jgi:murein DD-endopeptidase MepM/ murein hydrolase activator NlpD
MHWSRTPRALLLLTIVLTLVAGSGQALAQTKEDVEQAEENYEEAVDDLEFIEDDLDAAIERYQAVRGEIAEVSFRVNQLTDRVLEYEAEVVDLKDQVRQRAVDAYMTGGTEAADFDVFFDAGDLNEVVTGQQVMEQAAARDIVMVDRLEVAQREMESLRADLSVQEEEILALNEEWEDLVEELDSLWAAANDDVRTTSDEYQQAKKEYEEELARQRAAEAARRKGPAAGVQLALTPGFICPVQGSKWFRNDWGNPRSGGRTHKGNDMFAARGTPLVAVGAGTIRLRSGGLGGIAIWLRADHGTSYYYAHLDSWAGGLSTGSRVSKGQVIAYVGNSGNARGGAHHLHFQLHPGHGGPVNPYPTLAGVC